MDHDIVTKEHYNWAPRLVLVAFCTIFQAGPVGTSLGVKFGGNGAQTRKLKMYILVSKQSDHRLRKSNRFG